MSFWDELTKRRPEAAGSVFRAEGGPVYTFEGFRVGARRRVLSRIGGAPVPLAPKVFDTLLYFVERPGQLLDKNELMEAIWPNVVVDENNLNQAISTLRRVLGEVPGEHRFVVTEPGRGYRFVAHVRRDEWPVLGMHAVGKQLRSGLLRAAAAAMLISVAGITGWFLSRSFGPSLVEGYELYPVGPPVAEPFTAAPEGNRMVAASPDGARLAYDANDSIWLQTLGRQDATRIASGKAPFFSPDGEWIGFVSVSAGDEESLMCLSIYDRVPVPIAPLPSEGRYLGGSWTDETIVFAMQDGVYRVAADDAIGQPELIARAPESGTYAWPQILPGGRWVLLTVVSGPSIDTANIALLDLETRQLTETLVLGATGARYVSARAGSGGHLIYATDQRGRLAVREFDPRTHEVGAVPAVIPDLEVFVRGTYLAAAFDVTSNGSLLYVSPVPREQQRLVWIDHQGIEEHIEAVLPDGRFAYPRVSPDGRRVAFDAGGGTGRRRIWVMDLERGVPVELSESGDRAAAPYEDMQALWSRDGKRVYFTSLRSGDRRIWSRAANGSGNDEQLGDNPGLWSAVSVTPDNRIVVNRGSIEKADVALVDATEPHSVETLIESPYREFNPALSPDGQWLAYTSNELGDRDEIFVQSVHSSHIKRRISSHGGVHPRWGIEGSNELYYLGYTESDEVAMIAATLSFDDELAVVGERELFRKPYLSGMARLPSLRTYDISPVDGRFIFFVPLNPDEDDRLGVMTIWHMRNWIEAL